MVQLNTRLKVADNSGARVVKLLGMPGYGRRKYASVGDIVTVSVQMAIPNSDVKAHQVHRAVVARTAKEVKRKDGSYIRFDDNAAVLLNGKTKAPLGSRIFGPVARELKDNGFDKIVSLAPEVL
jgi:large subunit ribosomal protein L14